MRPHDGEKPRDSLCRAADERQAEREKEPDCGWGNTFDLEATYGARARSNWFHVKDPAAFKEFCKTWEVLPEYRPELDVYGVRCPYGIPSSEQIESGHPNDPWMDFSKELGKQLAPGCMAIVRCIKWTSGMYEAEAFIVDSEGNDKWINLDDLTHDWPRTKDGRYTEDMWIDEWQTAHFSAQEIARRTGETLVELCWKCPNCGFTWGQTCCTEDRKEQTIAWYHENWQPIGCLGCDKWWETKELIWFTQPMRRRNEGAAP